MLEPIDLTNQSIDNNKVPAAHTTIQPKIKFNEPKANDEVTYEYADQQSQGTVHSSTHLLKNGLIRSGNGTAMDLRIDLSSILQQREREQRGKQIYRVSRSVSKSPATQSGIKSVPKQSKSSKAVGNKQKPSKESTSGDADAK